MRKVVVPMTDGCEEIETTSIVDTLRRAGWEVVAAGFRSGEVVASRQMRLVPDCMWQEVDFARVDLIAIPGGAVGTENLRRQEPLLERLREFAGQGRWLAAICAGPLVLQEAGVLKGRKVTSHPAVRGEIREAEWVDAPVVADDRLVTSQGPGTALSFALALIALLESEEVADRIAGEMLVQRSRPFVATQ